MTYFVEHLWKILRCYIRKISCNQIVLGNTRSQKLNRVIYCQTSKCIYVCKLCIPPSHLTMKFLKGKLVYCCSEGQTLGTLAVNFIYSLTVNSAFIHLETRHILSQGVKKPYININSILSSYFAYRAWVLSPLHYNQAFGLKPKNQKPGICVSFLS